MITCKFENGREVNNARHAAVDAIVARGNEILIVKRSAEMFQAGKYCLPGGFIEHDESVEEAVKREVMEETGYEVKMAKLLFIVDAPERNEAGRQNISFVFLLEAGEKTGEPDHEVSEVLWRKLDGLPPAEEFTFDHYRIISEYKKSLKQKNPLPRFVSK
ncbi:MAG: NUDIX hydrolase [Patescibacteria group bacterium]